MLKMNTQMNIISHISENALQSEGTLESIVWCSKRRSAQVARPPRLSRKSNEGSQMWGNGKFVDHDHH